MTTYAYYSKPVEDLEMYQRLIQYWSLMFDPKADAKPIDHMNFDSNIFPPAITLTEIEQIVDFEPGYASPDGDIELGPLIRLLELTRLNRVNPNNRNRNKRLVEKAGLGAAHGCTNVMSGLLNSIPKLPKQIFPRQTDQPEVILTLPNYTVYVAQISNMSGVVTPKFIRANRENNFLPTFKQVKEAVSNKTVAIVITYPNNPAQSTYEGDSIRELKNIVAFCQKEGIFLIVDNIYQDELYPTQSRKHIEVFSLTDKLDYIIKVFGPSKDTTFFSGYRCGYWFGDPKLQNVYRYYVSATENTLSTVSMLMFAWDMLFRTKRFAKQKIKLSDMKLLNTGLFGWGKPFNGKRIYSQLNKMKLFEKYNKRVDYADSLMEKTNARIMDFIKNSKYFSDYVNQRIGNVFFIKVNPKYFKGNDDDFFHALLNGGYGVLPGNVFGAEKENGNVWFRITLIHDTCENIIKDLQGIERFLEKSHSGG